LGFFFEKGKLAVE